MNKDWLKKQGKVIKNWAKQRQSEESQSDKENWLKNRQHYFFCPNKGKEIKSSEV